MASLKFISGRQRMGHCNVCGYLNSITLTSANSERPNERPKWRMHTYQAEAHISIRQGPYDTAKLLCALCRLTFFLRSLSWRARDGLGNFIESFEHR